jgi:hypothetical protein
LAALAQIDNGEAPKLISGFKSASLYFWKTSGKKTISRMYFSIFRPYRLHELLLVPVKSVPQKPLDSLSHSSF